MFSDRIGCKIESLTDITDGKKGGITGTLYLYRKDQELILSWEYIMGSQLKYIQSENQNQYNIWEFNKPFRINCRSIHHIQIQPDLSLSIYGGVDGPKRQFSHVFIDFISVMDLFELLLIKGFAVPSAEKEYTLIFFQKCCLGVYPYIPPHILINYHFFDASKEMETLYKDFWDALHSFFVKLILHINVCDDIPSNPLFPFTEAARACHARVLKHVDEFIGSLPKFEVVRKDEWNSLFNENGQLNDPSKLRARLFNAGIENEALVDSLPFIFGVYDPASSKQERDELDSQLRDEFSQLFKQAVSIKEEQFENNKRLSVEFSIIQNDVKRTDRYHPAFKKENGIGLKMIDCLLKTYCVYNPFIGYVQGMNDLIVPILLAFLPRWNSESQPISDDGNIIDYKPYLPKIFWCFDAMLRNIGHYNLLTNVTLKCRELAITIIKIIKKVSPLSAIWMKRNKIETLIWCYSDFILLFKRSFPDIWLVWIQLNCSPYPPNWLAYYIAAIILLQFDCLAHMTKVNFTVMLNEFPKILGKVDIKEVGQITLWLSQQVPLISTQVNEEQIKMRNFKYFETEWTGPCQTILEFQNQ